MENLAVLNEQHPSGVASRLDGMRDHQKGLTAFVDAVEQPQKTVGGLAVQRAGGFVRQKQLRLGDQRPGNGSPLLLTAGNFIRELGEK